MRMIRWTAAAAAAVATLALTAVVPAGAAPDPLHRFYQQRLHWEPCTLGPDDDIGADLDQAGARCADVTVPLDYARPDGRTITVAISRLAASGPRIGTMVLNGGGPGPALDMPPYMRGIMGAAGPRYDLVGMDPRALGRSTPVDCGWPAGTWIKGAGLTHRSYDRAVTFAKDLAARCARTDRALLQHISTRNIARDMDVVRGALGERKVSYNGASYGTYLGQVYASMFPGRLDRVVLDSSQDLFSWGPRTLVGTEGANERVLGHWAAWTARRNAEYGLGGTRAEVMGTVHRVLKASARAPLAVGRYRLDDTMVPVVLFTGIDTDEDAARATLAASVRVLAAAAAGRPARPTPELDEQLAYLLTGVDGVYGSGQAAIICGDGAAPRDPAGYWRDVQRSRRAAPVFGPVSHNIGPCASWPARPAEPPVRTVGALPALMVAATGDTRTVYERNEVVHRMLRGSRMITLDADVHAPYQRGYPNRCVADTVNDYLLTGRLPARDLACAPA